MLKYPNCSSFESPETRCFWLCALCTPSSWKSEPSSGSQTKLREMMTSKAGVEMVSAFKPTSYSSCLSAPAPESWQGSTSASCWRWHTERSNKMNDSPANFALPYGSDFQSADAKPSLE